ncbi:ankyrin repeat domain-containing protein [Streptomyces sp. NPDC018693]|uniref:ankyrin repeat domain-containing protein n=1 Tax=unclassified Streptomyces TaxID=2593676 RepID=UPI0037ADB340
MTEATERAGRSAVPVAPEPVRIRCQGAEHELVMRDGRLRTCDHGPGEEEREEVVRALGGELSACFAVLRAWYGGESVPEELEAQRRRLFGAARAGDTAAVTALLDAGWDVVVPEAGTGKTLLHLLAVLDHTVLLDRLLKAGADVNATDGEGHSVLRSVVCEGGSPELVRALADSGADPTVFAGELFVWLEDHRQDLDFLVEQLDDLMTERSLAAA